MARPTLLFDHVGTNPIIISERKFPSLTSDHVGTPPTTLLEIPSTHIRQPMIKKAQHLHLAMQGTNPPWQKDLHLHLTTNVIKNFSLTSIQLMIKKGIALTFVQPMIKKGSTLTYVQPMIKKGSALTFDTYKEPIQHACSKSCTLTYDLVGNNPTVISEWPPVPDWATW